MKVLFKYKTILSTMVALTINYKNSDTCKHVTLSISHSWYMVNFDQEVAPASMCKIGFSSDNNIVTFLVIYVYFSVM
jgi:hypothetical protein